MMCQRLYVFIIFLFLSISNSSAQYYGLSFHGHEVDLDERTGLDLFPDKAISVDSDIELRFDFKFEPHQETYFGYIFRIILNETNIDLISSPHTEQTCNFHLVIGDRISDISFSLSIEELCNDWDEIRFRYDFEEEVIHLQVGDSLKSDQVPFNKKDAFVKVFFGAHRFERFNSTDVPSMKLREVEFFSGKKREFYWPLRQSEGNLVVEKLKEKNGIVINPNWIINTHSSWRVYFEKTFPGRINYAFNYKKNELAFFTEDSVSLYEISDLDNLSSSMRIEGSPSSRTQLIYDENDDLFLYVLEEDVKYRLQKDQDQNIVLEIEQYLTDNWHHNKLINPESNMLFTFGGYGQLRYSNNVFRFNDRLMKWDTVEYQGEFAPRYLAGIVFNPKDKKAYILGGYGSRTGNQEIAPGYYYDLLSYSFKENRFETIHDFVEEKGDFCFSSNLVIDTSTNTLFALKYSKLDAKSDVQAIAISLDDFSIQDVGDQFNYDFLDIKSTLDLFYSKDSKKLLAITSYFDDKDTRVKIFEIAYPPLNLLETGMDMPIEREYGSLWLIFLVIGIAAIFVFIVLRRKRGKEPRLIEHKDELDGESEVKKSKVVQYSKDIKPGSIIVFGGFQVIDKEGKDITNSFSTLLKELFLYIMLSSVRHDKGVSSNSLNEVFWFDKSDKAARNNRAVNIAKLRSLLEAVGECRISKDTGYWKFEFNPESIHIDYYEYLQRIRSDTKSEEGMISLLSILHRGPALSNIQVDWLDDFKSELSNEIIDSILDFTDKNNNADPDFLIQLTNCVFYFDMVNEKAMSVKCKLLASLGKHSLAKRAYEKFTKEYLTLYGEEYQNTFNQILVEDIS